MSQVSAPIAIECRQVGKEYVLSSEKYSTLKERLLRGGRGKTVTTKIHALRDVNFIIRQGEIVGLIGDNGSGKSTLLKLIAGITQPTTGELKVHGTVSSLLELGVGFHPEMTGRENVYLSGSLLGISREELDRRMPEIIAFSELEEFIDSPVKHYSSGMYLRLGFAIGIYVQPDVLLVDEILAVGDQRFQQKCKNHIRSLRQSGKTILFVSHDLDSILSICSRAIVINQGTVIGDGHPYEMIGLYKQHLFEEARKRNEPAPAEIVKRNRFGTFEIAFKSARMFDCEGNERYVFETGERVKVVFEWRAKQPIRYPIFGMSIHNDVGQSLTTVATDVTVGDVEEISGSGRTEFEFENLNLLEGAYSITYGISQREDGPGSSFDFYTGFDLIVEMCPFMMKPGTKGRGLRGSIYLPCKARMKAGDGREIQSIDAIPLSAYSRGELS